ncbi:MAG: nicotinate (nicotinamide) nucleotide adenylyltransferase [Spirochaetaceae bacterium]|jgi:nicotinate-nucleotide adenylyltransferase|nr:nicotinate (nicotinamide) nucleotide adenylyltransferase [Spirochaetaceae bacterium]
MKYAILGGSFDPVHKGHLNMAAAALPLGYDRIILVPAHQSPFKAPEQSETAEDRLLMLLAAISGNLRFTVDACEIQRGGVSYTIDTLDDIIERYQPDGKPALILGDDLAAAFPKWKDAERITREADVIIASRRAPARSYPYPCAFLDNDVMDISSGSVRGLIQRGEEWESLVPDGARQFIKEHGLYEARPIQLKDAENSPKIPASGGAAFIRYVEDATRGMMKPRRFIHSRNVALHSADLAGRYGIDTGKAYIAGVIHDICKEFNIATMREYALKDGAALNELEREKPDLLHGRAAAMLIQEKFGIQDTGIIEAARFHTSGKQGMGALAKIVYIADKIEAARTTVDPSLRRLAFSGANSAITLDALFNAVLQATVEWLLARGLTVADETLTMYSGYAHEKTNRL